MNEIPVTNNGKNMLECGGHLIPPGETRILPAHHVPAHLRPDAPAPAPEPKADPLLSLLDETVGDIVASFAALSDEELARLEAAEEAGKTRKSLMAAFAEETMRRANDRAGAGDGAPSGDGGGAGEDEATDD